MINNLQIADIFKSKTMIDFLDGEAKQVGKQGPMGVHSKAATSTNYAAKYNSAAVFLQDLLKNKQIFIASGKDNIYMEINSSLKVFFDGSTISWNKAFTSLDQMFYPVFAYFLCSNIPQAKEYQDCFQAIKKDMLSNGKANPLDVLTFCDSFYYSFKSFINYAYRDDFDESVTDAAIEQAFATGQLSIPNIVADIGMPTPEMAVTVEPIKQEVKNSISMADICNGETILSYGWDDEQKARIPNLTILEDYVPCKAFYSMVRKVSIRLNKCMERLDVGKTGAEAIGKDYINAFITGKPGTGKTTMAYALGAALGMPVYTIATSKNTEEDEYEGKTKVAAGQLAFMETDFLKAYEHGGIIVLEEINLADPGVTMGALGQAIEYPFVIMKDGYTPIHRHPMCVILGTFNTGTDGAKPINQALSSRFRQTYILDDPTKDDFIAILMSHGFDKKSCKWVYNVYSKIFTYLKGPDVNKEEYAMNLTLRACLGALENIEEGDSPLEAIENSMIGKIAEVDLEVAEEVKKNVLRNIPALNM